MAVPVNYQTIGAALEALGEAVAASGAPGAEAAARYINAVGQYANGIQGVVDGETAGHIIAAAVGSAAIAADFPIATMGAPVVAAVVAAGAPEAVAVIVAAGVFTVVYWAGTELTAATYDLFYKLGEMLGDLLADPLVLDLDGDGIELIPVAQSAAMFDVDGDGVTEHTGWVSPQDGFLVRDANGNGIVDGVGEMFGTANVDGFDVLTTFDANNDGRITASDPVFADLRVWRDLNSDGISTADEMMTLSQAGISSFNLSSTQVDSDVAGNVIARTGSYVRTDGSARTMASVDFALEETRPGLPANADLSEVAILPNLSGQAGLPDLRTAMVLDPTLKSMVDDLVYGNHDFNTFVDFRDGGFLAVLYRWAGVDTSVPLNPEDQPYFVQALSAFLGRPFDELNSHQQEQLDNVWPEFVKELGAMFLVQAAELPSVRPFHDMQDALAALNPDQPDFQSALASILENAISSSAAAQPAYDYLRVFTQLHLDLGTGEITGDFDAFVAQFIQDEPSFFTSGWAAGGGGSGGNAITMGGDGGQAGNRHPWTAWYEDEGSLLFAVAGAMGLGPDYVLSATGWRWLAGQATDEHGASGNDVMDYTVTQYTYMVTGSSGSSLVTVDTRDQRLFGHEGNDELRGNDGVDRLIGGPGNDLLKGGSDSDMYVYASGDGLDRIIDESGADDTIYFSSELNSADLRVSRVAGTSDLQLHFGDLTSGIILTNQWSSAATAIEQVHFVGEDGLDAGDIASIYLASLATAGADTITGSWASERLIGLDGNDTLSGAMGDDVLDGGVGDDILDGGDGNDVINGNSGNDTIDGGFADDILIGGAGNDVIGGGRGDDTYRFARGDGQDVVLDATWNGGYGGNDTIEFAAGISVSDVTVVQSNNGNDLIIKINGTTDQITLSSTMTNWGRPDRAGHFRRWDSAEPRTVGPDVDGEQWRSRHLLWHL